MRRRRTTHGGAARPVCATPRPPAPRPEAGCARPRPAAETAAGSPGGGRPGRAPRPPACTPPARGRLARSPAGGPVRLDCCGGMLEFLSAFLDNFLVLFFIIIRRPPKSTLFLYTTLP